MGKEGRTPKSAITDTSKVHAIELALLTLAQWQDLRVCIPVTQHSEKSEAGEPRVHGHLH